MRVVKPPCEVMRAAREKAGKTQQEIADEVGVTQPLIHKWESGDGFPRTEDIRRVAKAYGVKPDQLIPADEAKAS